MRRTILLFLSVVMLLGVSGTASASVAAQDTATAGHPLVGTWLADTDQESSDNALDTFAFSSDGTYYQSEAGGGSLLGAWEATGERSATLIAVGAEADEDGTNFGSIWIRAAIQVSEDGKSFTAEYTIEFVQPDGTSSGEAGPGIATGERLVVEAPGTPTATLNELFGGFDGEPEATPES